MNNENNRQILNELMAAQESGEAVVLATIVRARGSVPRHSGSKMIVYTGGRTSGTIGGGELESRIVTEALACLADGQTRIVPFSLVDPQRGDPGLCGGEVEVYLEPYLPPVTILVIGCGHVGKALASLAKWMGYRVVVSDDRPEMATCRLSSQTAHSRVKKHPSDGQLTHPGPARATCILLYRESFPFE